MKIKRKRYSTFAKKKKKKKVVSLANMLYKINTLIVQPRFQESKRHRLVRCNLLLNIFRGYTFSMKYVFRKLTCFDASFKNRIRKRLRARFSPARIRRSFVFVIVYTDGQMMRTDNYSVADFNWTRCGISACVSFVP